MAFVPLDRDALKRRYGEFFERRNRQFDVWLAGPEADSPYNLSAEYLAFSNMRMAFDYLSVLT